MKGHAEVYRQSPGPAAPGKAPRSVGKVGKICTSRDGRVLQGPLHRPQATPTFPRFPSGVTEGTMTTPLTCAFPRRATPRSLPPAAVSRRTQNQPCTPGCPPGRRMSTSTRRSTPRARSADFSRCPSRAAWRCWALGLQGLQGLLSVCANGKGVRFPGPETEKRLFFSAAGLPAAKHPPPQAAPHPRPRHTRSTSLPHAASLSCLSQHAFGP